MARGDLPATVINRGGVAAAAEHDGDSVNGHQFTNANGDVVLLVRNADGSNPHTVTIHVHQQVDGQSVASRAVAVPASSSKYFGPFPPGVYGSPVLVDADSAQLKLSTYQVPR